MPVKSHTKPIKVGFDLDGVILYNPIRILRPLISDFKAKFMKRRQTKFYIPQNRIERFVWSWLHKSSLFVAPGFEEVVDLVAQGRIEAYLITARYDYLKDDLSHWLKKINHRKIFKQIFYNQDNRQPHLYKANLIKALDLDLYIEDNWDIVQHLSALKLQGKLKADIYWITNVLDRRIPYPHKYLTFKQAVARLKQLVRTS